MYFSISINISSRQKDKKNIEMYLVKYLDKYHRSTCPIVKNSASDNML